jgi:hypothetical protein
MNVRGREFMTSMPAVSLGLFSFAITPNERHLVTENCNSKLVKRHFMDTLILL